MYSSKLHIWQLLEAIFSLHNLMKMLAEINEHACIKKIQLICNLKDG